MEQFGATRELRVSRAQKVAFGINQRAYPGEVWHLVGQTETSYGCKTITLRSILQVINIDIIKQLPSEYSDKIINILPWLHFA